jgi:hypothetical protein
MVWHILSILCTVIAASTAFVPPIGRVVQPKQPRASILFAPSTTHVTSSCTQLNADARTVVPGTTSILCIDRALTLAVAGRIPWGKIILDHTQRMKLVSIVRKETHFLDISVVSCRLWEFTASS